MSKSKRKQTTPVTVQPMAEVPKGGDAWDKHVEHVLGTLHSIYNEAVEPVERRYEYNVFRPSWFSNTVKQKKPFVTFLGPSSAGKSTFINYLMQSNLLHTGPHPVTDKFTVVMYGSQVQHIPGRVLLADANQPFQGLAKFGDAFADAFCGLQAPHPILQSVAMIDTPGIMEAAGVSQGRKYDYVKVCQWFVEKSDLVVLLFDPTKLDAGSEMRAIFTSALKGHGSKIRIVLNKSDSVRPRELVRVYGALFWNLSKMIGGTEPPRVFMASMWDKAYAEGTDHELLNSEKEDLLYELVEMLPTQSLDRRVTQVMRRATQVLIFSLVCATYRSKIPAVFGRDKAKANFFADYDVIVKDLCSRHQLSEEDFPAMEEMQTFLSRMETGKIPDMDRLQKSFLGPLTKAIRSDLPALLQPIKQHAVSDPRDSRRASTLMRDYSEQYEPSRPHSEVSSACKDYRMMSTSNAPDRGTPSIPVETKLQYSSTPQQDVGEEGLGVSTSSTAPDLSPPEAVAHDEPVEVDVKELP